MGLWSSMIVSSQLSDEYRSGRFFAPMPGWRGIHRPSGLFDERRERHFGTIKTSTQVKL
jgi:hypothetical protein